MSPLKQYWKKWKAFGRKAGDLLGRLLMTVFYFTLAAPFGLIVRFFGDPLKLKRRQPRWEPRPKEETDLKRAREGF
ncbi:MAG: hypothetical protein NTV82_18110 [Candidatus Aminicenantes bacterium]|nr:hypothetical protein [Candidatus Aminicenantes bacterium]